MDPSTLVPVNPQALALGALFSALAGSGLSAAFKFFPGLSDWYAGRPKEVKSLIMLGMVVLAAVGVAFWTCSDGACAGNGDWKVYVLAIFGAAAGNTSTHQLLPNPERIEAIKARRPIRVPRMKARTRTRKDE